MSGPWENVASTLVELLRLSENAAAKILALEKSVGEIPKQGHLELLRREWESLNKKLAEEKMAIDQLLESHQAMARQLLMATEDQKRTDRRSIQTQWIVLGLVLGVIGLSGYNALLQQGTVNDLRQLRSKADSVQEILEDSVKTREELLKSSLESHEKSGDAKNGLGGETSTRKSIE